MDSLGRDLWLMFDAVSLKVEVQEYGRNVLSTVYVSKR